MARKKKNKKKSPSKASVPAKAAKPTVHPTSPENAVTSEDTKPLFRQYFSLKISEIVFLRMVFILLGMGLLGYLFYELRSVLTPIFLALLLAYLINPLVDKMVAKGASRNFAIAMLVVSITCILVVSIVLLLPALGSSLESLSKFLQDFPTYLAKGKKWVQATLGIDLPNNWLGALKKWGAEIKNYAPKAIKPISIVLSKVFASSLNVLLALFHFLLVPLFTYYFLKDFHAIKGHVFRHIPPRYEDFVQSRLSRMNEMISGFVRGQMMVSLVVGTLYMVLLTIMQVPFAPVIAVVGALINVIPYLGFMATFGIALAATLIELQSGTQLLIVFLGMGGIHMIDVFMITPKVVGDKVGLSEMMVIVAVLCGGQLFGFLGVLLAVPTAAVLKVILEDVLHRYHTSPFFTGSSPEKE